MNVLAKTKTKKHNSQQNPVVGEWEGREGGVTQRAEN